MKSLEFIQQVASGNASDAKSTLDNLLSTMAFEALSAKKQSIAQTVFNTPQVQEEGINEESLTKGMRRVYDFGTGTHTARVYHNKDYNEYQVHFYKEGKHLGEGPIHYTNDKDDAKNSAFAGIKRLNDNLNK